MWERIDVQRMKMGGRFWAFKLMFAGSKVNLLERHINVNIHIYEKRSAILIQYKIYNTNPAIHFVKSIEHGKLQFRT